MRTRSRRAGGALIVSMTMIVVIFGVVAALAVTTSMDLNAVSASDRMAHAGLAGLSGFHIAMTELNTGKNLDTGTIGAPGPGAGMDYPVVTAGRLSFRTFPATTQYIQGRPTGDTRVGYTVHESAYERVVTRVLDANTETEITIAKPYPEALLIDVVAEAGLSHGKFVAGRSDLRHFRVTLRRTIPFPSQANAAISILGDPSKGKVNIIGRGDGTLIGDGTDQSAPLTGVPGIGIEGRAIDKLKQRFQDASFQGYGPDGNVVTGSQPIADATLDFGAIDTAAQAMDAHARDLVAATLPTTITNGTQGALQSYALGSSASSVTVLAGAGGRGTDYRYVNITGQGTLVIDGSVDFHGSTINWNGPIYVLGDGNAKNELKIDHTSSVTVNGDVFVLGVDDRSAKITVHGDNSGHTTNALTVNGALLAVSDRSGRSSVDVNLKGDGTNGGHQSKIQINGYFGLFGDKVKLSAVHKNNATFEVNGSMVLAVPDRATQSKVDVNLSTNVDVNFNSQLYNQAIEGIAGFLREVDVPPSYTVGAFYEPAMR